MPQRILQKIPVPALGGFILSIPAAVVGFLFSIHTTLVFAVLLSALFCLLLVSEYKLPLIQYFYLALLALLGHFAFLILRIGFVYLIS